MPTTIKKVDCWKGHHRFTAALVLSCAVVLSAATPSTAQRTYEFIADGVPPFNDFDGDLVATLTIDQLPVTSAFIEISILGSSPLSVGSDGGEPYLLSKAPSDVRTLSETSPGGLGCTECSGSEFLEYRFDLDLDPELELGAFFVSALFTQSGQGTIVSDNFGATEMVSGEWVLAVPEPATSVSCFAAVLTCVTTRQRKQR